MQLNIVQFNTQLTNISQITLLLVLMFTIGTVGQAQNVPTRIQQAKNILHMLSTGGYTVYVRHTHTDRIRGDTDLTDCNKQRLLSEQGREEAKNINESFQQLNFPVGRLISTEYCRTKETTELAFHEDYEIISRNDLAAQLTTLLGTPPATGTNTFIVAHIGTLEGATGIKTSRNIPFGEGDSIIFKPTAGGGYEIAGFIDVLAWPILVEANTLW